MIARVHPAVRLLSVACLLLLTTGTLLGTSRASAQEADQLQITSKHYIVVNADNGDVFAQKGAHDQVAIASLTKLFTAVEALELAPLDTEITTNESDLMPADATTMGFAPGETYTLKDLLYGMLLPSGNDAAHAIARGLGAKPGDTDDQAVKRFMDLVNQRVADLGLKDTHLVNPHGWGVPGHHSSAWDVATFMRYAMNYPTLVKIIGTSSYTTSNGLITVTQSNKMINTYAPLIGGKTGYDNDAGWCLVNLAQKGDVKMIAVTLDGVAPDDWYDDNTVLLNYGFNQQATLSGSNQAFSGDVATFIDPSAAQIGRSVKAGESVSGQQVSKPHAVPSKPEVAVANDVQATSPPLEHDGGAGGWWIDTTVLGLVLISGLITYRLRWSRGRREPRSVDTTAHSN